LVVAIGTKSKENPPPDEGIKGGSKKNVLYFFIYGNYVLPEYFMTEYLQNQNQKIM